jgi:acid phosphatase
MENHGFDRVVDDPCCPYISKLAKRSALFTRWSGIRYPSLPNYLAMTGGSTFDRTTDATSPLVAGDNLFDQLTAARIRWRVYQESMPSACFRGSTGSAAGGEYALKHDPR